MTSTTTPAKKAPAAGSVLHLRARYVAWLAAKVAVNSDTTPGCDDPDAECEAQCETFDRLSREIIAAPLIQPCGETFHYKFDVIRSYLGDDPGGWTDNRILLALGALEADIQTACDTGRLTSMSYSPDGDRE